MPPPERWDAYCPLGKVIPGTKFVAFKVPLKDALMSGVQDKDKFSPRILLETLNSQGIKLGLVIDLTFTLKYYNREEFLKESIMHKKIFVQGGSGVPDDSSFQEFAETVKNFDKDDHFIGVHCTHGLNRTGYLVCRYMIEELDFEPGQAIASFNEARGHPMERDSYIHDLRCRKKGQSSISYENRRNGASRDPQGAFVKKPRWRNHREDHPFWRKNGEGHHTPGPPRYDAKASPWIFRGSGEHRGSQQNRFFNNGSVNEPECSFNAHRPFPHGGSAGGYERYSNPSMQRTNHYQSSALDHRPGDAYSQSSYERAGWGTNSRHPHRDQRSQYSHHPYGARYHRSDMS